MDGSAVPPLAGCFAVTMLVVATLLTSVAGQTELQRFDPGDGALFDGFGDGVAMDGDVVVSGAWGHDSFTQFWISDPAGPAGFSATDSLRAIVP